MSYEKSIDKLKKDNYVSIVEAFEELLFSNENELSKVSMNEVAQLAGLTKRTVYKYFESKDELHYEVMIRGYKVMHQHLSLTLKKDSTKTDIELLMNAFYEYTVEYQNYYNLIMNYKTKQEDFINPTERIKECYSLGQVTMQYIVDAVQKGMDSGVFRSDLDVIEATMLVWSFATGILNTMSQKLDYVHEYYQINREEFIQKGINQIVRILQ